MNTAVSFPLIGSKHQVGGEIIASLHVKGSRYNEKAFKFRSKHFNNIFKQHYFGHSIHDSP